MSLLAVVFSLLQNASNLANLFSPQPVVAAPAAVEFYFINRLESESFALTDAKGTVRPEILPELAHFVRCYRTYKEKPIHPRLIEIVSKVAEHFNVRRMDVVSGYRSKPYGAPHSKHFLGHAMDLHIPGVASRKIADWVWRNFDHVGVGFYPRQDFVHVDVRADDVRWTDRGANGEGTVHAQYSARKDGGSKIALRYDAAQRTGVAAAKALMQDLVASATTRSEPAVRLLTAATLDRTANPMYQ